MSDFVAMAFRVVFVSLAVFFARGPGNRLLVRFGCEFDCGHDQNVPLPSEVVNVSGFFIQFTKATLSRCSRLECLRGRVQPVREPRRIQFSERLNSSAPIRRTRMGGFGDGARRILLFHVSLAALTGR